MLYFLDQCQVHAHHNSSLGDKVIGAVGQALHQTAGGHQEQGRNCEREDHQDLAGFR